MNSYHYINISLVSFMIIISNISFPARVEPLDIIFWSSWYEFI